MSRHHRRAAVSDATPPSAPGTLTSTRQQRPTSPQLGRLDRQHRRDPLQRLPLDHRRLHPEPATGSRSRPRRATPTPASPPAPTTTRSRPRTPPATSAPAPTSRRADGHRRHRTAERARHAHRERLRIGRRTSSWGAATDNVGVDTLQRLPLDHAGFTPAPATGSPSRPGRATPTPASPPAPTTTRSPPRTPPATSARRPTRRARPSPPTPRRRRSSITAPAAGATVSGAVTRHRERDRQRRRRRRPVQARRRRTSAPRTHARRTRSSWDTRGRAQRRRTRSTAVARDAAGNTTTSAPVDGDGQQHRRLGAGLAAPTASTRAAARPPPTRRATAAPARSSTRPGRRRQVRRRRSRSTARRIEVDPPTLGTFYKTGIHLEAWVYKQSAKVDVARRRHVGRRQRGGADDLGRPRHRPLPADARRELRRTTSTRAARRPSAAGSTSPPPMTGRPRASTSTASRRRARPTPGTSATPTRWRIGAYGASATGFFDGAIDNVRVYNRALSASEIQTDMASRDPARHDAADGARPRRRRTARPASTSAPRLTATFSEPMTPSSITSSTFLLRGLRRESVSRRP